MYGHIFHFTSPVAKESKKTRIETHITALFSNFDTSVAKESKKTRIETPLILPIPILLHSCKGV